MSDWPFGALSPLSYDVIIADPPWLFGLYSDRGEKKAPQAHYGCMAIDEIKALPVSALCRGDAICLMWATWPMLQEGLATLKAWGFRYCTGGAWHKRTSTGKSAFGTGFVMRSATEPFLIGTLHSPLTARNVRNVIDAPRREHSRKPDEQYAVLEQLCPRALRGVELFARQRWTQGAIQWDAWGNQADRFASLQT